MKTPHYDRFLIETMASIRGNTLTFKWDNEERFARSIQNRTRAARQFFQALIADALQINYSVYWLYVFQFYSYLWFWFDGQTIIIVYLWSVKLSGTACSEKDFTFLEYEISKENKNHNLFDSTHTVYLRQEVFVCFISITSLW